MRYAIKHLKNYSNFSILKRYMLYKMILNSVFTSLKPILRYDKFIEINRVKFRPKIGVKREAQLIC